MSDLRLYFRYLGVSIRSQMEYRASMVMLSLGQLLLTQCVVQDLTQRLLIGLGRAFPQTSGAGGLLILIVTHANSPTVGAIS